MLSAPQLPGFGLPLDYEPKDQPPEKRLFPSALSPKMHEYDYPARIPAFTLRELKMLRLMNSISDKNNWEEKVFDETITNKWREEVLLCDNTEEIPGSNQESRSGEEDVEVEDTTGGGDTQGTNGEKTEDEEMDPEGTDSEDVHDADYEGEDHDDVTFTVKMFDYCIAELKHKAELSKKTGLVHVYCGDVVKSDTAIPKDLQVSLRNAVAPLENVPISKQDWHPDSDDQVLDLVHPSLYPFVYGLSRILSDSITTLDDCIARCGDGEIPSTPSTIPNVVVRGASHNAYSNKFQWLPCEVDISGESPRILTYINNLHPQKYAEIYRAIERVIEQVIPLWNATLSPLREDKVFQRITYSKVVSDLAAYEEYVTEEVPSRDVGESEDDYEDRVSEWKFGNKWRFYVHPDVGTFSPPENISKVDLKRDYADKGLQIIIKLANIHLTPEKPDYPGGTWHIEGQLNEHICALAIYYYDSSNISPSYLAFRQAVNPTHILFDVPYGQNDNDWLEIIYGLENWQPGVQDIGSIETREGRLITFPNVLQHQVQPFQLEDPTKPGHRKILALFLVDPNIKIISTVNVPCQRHDWWGEAVISDSETLGRLPVELRDKIVKEVEGFPIKLDQAKGLREELMKERKEYVIGYQDQNFASASISLCEH